VNRTGLRWRRVGAAVTGAGMVAVGTSLANAVGYALTVVAARLLDPEEFGAFGALLAFIIAGSVAALAAQATTAGDVARGEPPAPSVRSGLLLAAAVGIALVLFSPVLVTFLQLPSVVPAIAAGAAVAAFTATAPALGMVQGAERFQALGTLVAVQAVLRVTGGLAGMAIQPTAAGALVGIAVGLVLAGVVAWVVARPPLGWSHDGATKGTMRATLASGSMLLGFVVLTNVDVVLARHVLSAEASGLYVAGSVFTKIAFWLPQFVPLVAFPALTDPRRRRGAVRLGLLAVVGCGLVLVAATALFAEPVVSIVAGPRYESLTPWVAGFTALGALLAVAQLLVYAHLASGDRLTTAVVWVILAGYVAVVEHTASGIGGVLVPALTAAGLVVLWGRARERATNGRAAMRSNLPN
jgi:O-antigen/teichoic acid export membrane protein